MTANVDARLDSLDMFGLALGLPDQIEAAAEAVAGGVAGLPTHEEIEQVLICGMGGSGIAGDVVSAVAAPESSVPIMVSKDYEVPGYVGPGTLLVAVSFSGNTEETIDVATEAVGAGARVVTVSAGGELARLGKAWKVPHVPLLDGIAMPRAGIGALVAPLVAILADTGLYPTGRADLADAVAQLRLRRDELAAPGSSAEELARRIGRTFPIVYGGGPIGTVVARRWKGQFNENAKVPSWLGQVPELCHNEAAGWGQHGDVSRQVITAIFLRHDQEHPQIDRRFELLDELMLEVVAGIEVVRAEGEGPLAQLFDLVMQGDLVSLHLAAQAGVDPGPIPALDFIKNGLAG